MNTTPNQPGQPQSGDRDNWAQPVSKLTVSAMPTDATNLNVEGRRVVGPLQGFGQLWQKTYRIRLSGNTLSPTDVVRIWKDEFPKFWPEGNRFYAPLIGIKPGEVALLKLAMPGGMPLSTGMLVIYSDDESFTLMTPQGHMESGWITFSAFEENGSTVAQVQSIARANDPLYEIGFLIFAHRRQEKFWHDTLDRLADHLGGRGDYLMTKTCVDPRWQWGQVPNLWLNAAVRTGIWVGAAPGRWIRRGLSRRSK